MPWTPLDAKRHTKKATSPRLTRMWSEVANSVLSSSGDEARAVREANAAVGKATRRSRLAKQRRTPGGG